MPGKRIKRQQIEVYMKYRIEDLSQETAAAKAGMSLSSGQRIDQKTHCSFNSKKKWRTRKDPFEGIWEEKIVPLLEKSPKLMATTILSLLQKDHPDQFSEGLLRTLQRKVAHWKALNGPEKPVIFPQIHHPGEQGLSDFTQGKSLNITIKNQSFEHIFYHFVLSYSKWEYVKIILGGESYPALAEGLQKALRHLGGAPKSHRTDSLSAAYKNLARSEKSDFTKGYQELCNHYGMRPTRNNKGVSHENGSVESAHGHFRRSVEQALLLRDSRDFSSIEEYQKFISCIVFKRNQKKAKKVEEEKTFLQSLPIQKTRDYELLSARVSSFSTINIKQVIYSVPSRLIGLNLTIHLYDDRFQCYLSSSKVIELKRKRRKGGSKRINIIDYRHIAASLVKKPQAFRNYRYRESLFPHPIFKTAWEFLDSFVDSRKACQLYVRILYMAVKQGEETIITVLEEMLCKKEIMSISEIEQTVGYIPKKEVVTQLKKTDLSDYRFVFSGGVR